MFLQLLESGIAQGAVYSLVALGMTVLYRTTKVLNFGYGATFMFGAFAFYVALKILGLPFGVSVLAAIAFMLFVGVALSVVIFQPILKRPHLFTAMMTVAIANVFRGTTNFVWGGQVQPMPPVFKAPPILLGSVVVTSQTIVIVCTTAVIVMAFFLFFQFSEIGKLMQAASHSARGAALIGVNVPKFNAMMWAFATGVAAVAGILVSPITLLHPGMGGPILLKAFAAMAVGGFGSLPGAVLGGMILGISEQLCGGYISTSFMQIFPYLVIILVLLMRPVGLLGTQEVSRV